MRADNLLSLGFRLHIECLHFGLKAIRLLDLHSEGRGGTGDQSFASRVFLASHYLADAVLLQLPPPNLLMTVRSLDLVLRGVVHELEDHTQVEIVLILEATHHR